jgi:hypothetical protein
MPAAQVRLSAGAVPDSRPRLQRMEVFQIKSAGIDTAPGSKKPSRFTGLCFFFDNPRTATKISFNLAGRTRPDFSLNLSYFAG